MAFCMGIRNDNSYADFSQVCQEEEENKVCKLK